MSAETLLAQKAPKLAQPAWKEKWGLKFFTYIPHMAAHMAILHYTRNPFLMLLSLLTLLHVTPKFMTSDHDIDQKASQTQKQAQTAELTRSNHFHNRHQYHLIPLIVHPFLTWALFTYFWRYSLQICSQGLTKTPFGTFLFIVRFIFLTICMALITSPSIDASHELLHRPQLACRLLAYVNQTMFLYATYPVFHLTVHHKLVNTQYDPVTSPKGQSLFKYFFKVMWGSYKANWNYSKPIFTACVAAHLSLIYFVYSISQKYIFETATPFDFINSHSGLFRFMSFLYLIFSCLLVMEAVEYLQHYGLDYHKIENPKLKQFNLPDNPHSTVEVNAWNYDSKYENFIHFRAQRHADHHLHAYKLFSTILFTQKMLRIPVPFSSAVFLSFTPQKWYRLMDPIVDEVLKVRIAAIRSPQTTSDTQQLQKLHSLQEVMVCQAENAAIKTTVLLGLLAFLNYYLI